jgi:hypothetical protein
LKVAKEPLPKRQKCASIVDSDLLDFPVRVLTFLDERFGHGIHAVDAPLSQSAVSMQWASRSPDTASGDFCIQTPKPGAFVEVQISSILKELAIMEDASRRPSSMSVGQRYGGILR